MLPYPSVALGRLSSASRALKMFLISKIHPQLSSQFDKQTLSLNSIISVKLKGTALPHSPPPLQNPPSKSSLI